MSTKKKSTAVESINVSLQSPWVIQGKKIINLFSKDPSITITDNYENGKYTLFFQSDDKAKLDALSRVLDNYVQMGNISFVLEFDGIDGEENNAAASVEDWKKAFQGNPYFINLLESGPLNYTFAIFKREIISIYTDNLMDYCYNNHYIVANLIDSVMNHNTCVVPCTSAV